MKKHYLLPLLGILALAPTIAFAGTFSVSNYNWHESIPNNSVNENGVKIGYDFAPFTLAHNLTYQSGIAVGLLHYRGSDQYNVNDKVSTFSLHLIINDYLDYQLVNYKNVTLDAYGGLHALFRDIDPGGKYSTNETYLEPRVGIRAGYNINSSNQIHVGVYRAIKVWEFTHYGTFNPDPKLGYEFSYDHQFSKKYTASLYGDISSYGVSDKKYNTNGSYYYQPKTQVSEVGVKFKVVF